MAGVNKIIIVGNLGRDPEVRYSQGGMAICTFTVAVGERKKEGEQWKEHTEWFRVKSFGKTAENAGQYLQKGKQVYVEGRLEQSKYKDKEGQERTSVDVIANTIQFLGGAGGPRRDAGEGGGAPRPQGNAGNNNRPQQGGGGGGDDAPPASDGFIDDDLPF